MADTDKQNGFEIVEEHLRRHPVLLTITANFGMVALFIVPIVFLAWHNIELNGERPARLLTGLILIQSIVILGLTGNLSKDDIAKLIYALSGAAIGQAASSFGD